MFYNTNQDNLHQLYILQVREGLVRVELVLYIQNYNHLMSYIAILKHIDYFYNHIHLKVVLLHNHILLNTEGLNNIAKEEWVILMHHLNNVLHIASRNHSLHWVQARVRVRLLNNLSYIHFPIDMFPMHLVYMF